MLRTKARKNLRNPDSKDEKEKVRQREIANFIARKGVTRVEGGKAISTLKDIHARCQICGSWTNDSNEYEHYDWCPTLKRSSRKNPIALRKSSKTYRNLIELDVNKTSKNHIFVNYQGKEIEFTGKDAEDLRDIMKYQLKLFRGSTKLQKLFPKDLDDSGGFDTYITEQLQKVYPNVFK